MLLLVSSIRDLNGENLTERCLKSDSNFPSQTRGFSISLPIILLSTTQFREGYINRKIGKLWRRWERTTRLRQLELLIHKEYMIMRTKYYFNRLDYG